MNYLLDTCIVLWALDNSPKLSKEFTAIIENIENTIYISVASYWEIAIKKSLGKLEVPQNWIDFIEETGFSWLPIYPSHIHYLETLLYLHSDPFDRILISQARAEKFKLLTVDEKILQYGS